MHRDERSFLLLERFLQTLRISMRSLLKNRGLSIAILLTLGAGIGANTAAYTVVYAVLLAPSPSPHPEQLVVVSSAVNGHNDWVSAGDFLDWKRQTSTFEELSAWSTGGFNLSSQEQPENIRADHVTTNFFHMMGDRFYLGRDLIPEEGEAGRDQFGTDDHGDKPS
jgi:putative ABC transport system permease protein